MQLEDVQLAIRPRTILECCDVTFLFCGRHWFGLLLASCAGIVPFACFNTWVAEMPQRDGYEAYLLLMLEIPWATMWITLYLGQTIFQRRLSIRRMFNDGMRAVPGLIAFQGLVRGACMAIVVLAPVSLIGMYYVNEIILLEKSPLSKIWTRRTAMNRQILGHVFSIRLIEVVIMLVGVYGLSAFFHAVSSLWEDQLDFTEWLFFDSETQGEFFVPDWQTQLSFWVMIVFLTVFRFVTYLDNRIRREGWDVELKLRAQAELYRQREAAE